MSDNPTGSEIERGVHCAASFALPVTALTTEAGLKGGDNHEKIEIGVAGQNLEGLPRIVRDLLERATEVDVEVAFALDVETRTCRLIGRRLNRKYGPLAPGEIALTLDAIVTRPDDGVVPGEILVVDWKSRKRVAATSKNWQLRAQAVAVMLHLGLSEVVGVVGYLDDNETDAHLFDRFDVAAFWEDMAEMMNRIGAARALVATGQVPVVHAGPWCLYCPAMAYCPAQTRMALAMIGDLVNVEKDVAFMTQEQAGKAWDLLQQINAVAKRVEDSLRLRARQDPLYLGDGRVVAAVQCTGRMSMDQAAVKKRFEELGEPVPMKRGADFVQVKEVTLKKGRAA